MARKIRLFFDDIALHIQVSGINQEKIFRDDEDYRYYKELLQTLSKSLHVSIHSYALLPSFVHLLCTFDNKDNQSRFMQSLGLKYVSYYNKKYNRSGTLWQGRYKSSLVEDRYILQVMQYIETLSDAKYSSLSANRDAVSDAIVKQHEVYKLLGKDGKDRASIYKNIFMLKPLKKDVITFIESHLLRQSITGTKEFYEKLEKMVGESLRTKKRGRPKKILKKGKKMFTKLVVLDKEKHKSLKVSALQNLNFAKDLKFIPILANEIGLVSEMFPVVFTADETPSLVALTSLGDKNLAINAEGKYISRYVPAFLRKYPFSLASTEKNPDEKVILIDEEAENVSKTKGKQLFTKDGKESEVLKNAINFLKDYEKQQAETIAVAKAIKEAGILEDREISIGEGDEKRVLVKGFQVVSREKLNNLDDKVLASWVRNGIITFLDSHIKSLSKIETLFKIASQNQ